MFVDEIVITAKAGDGGDGAVAFRREAHVPRGGPSGGDGGRGGSVILRADESLNTLQDLRYKRHATAKRGQNGRNKKMHGKSANDLVLDVPVGTLIFDDETDQELGDLVEHGQEFVIAKGGDGGRGNARFTTSTDQAPRHFEPGWPGEERKVRLELKLLADVGLLGYPSVGKSTLISRISNAKPRIEAWPFTTLTPKLGVVRWRDYQEFVVADIPGLIEGASEGKGLGHQFLRHIERSGLLVHLIEVTPQLEGHEDERAAIADFERINSELANFDPELAERPQVVVLNKIDLPKTRDQVDELRAHFEGKGYEFFAISAVTGQGVQELVDALGQKVVAKR